MQRLKVFQSLWAMEKRRPGVPEDPPEAMFRRIAEAGFDGVCLDPAVDEIETMQALAPLFEHHGLGCMINAFPRALDELVPLLGLAKNLGAEVVNVVGQVMPFRVRDGVIVLRRWLDDAERAGVPVLFETHRDSILNDLYYTVQLLERMPDLRLAADLSHCVVDREMRLPPSEQDAYFVQCVLERADCLQGRIATREQIQVPIAFAQHRGWVSQFRAWWDQGIRHWRRNHGDDDTLVFLCELGPPPYAITDVHQEELSDRWEEALTIREWVRASWDGCSA